MALWQSEEELFDLVRQELFTAVVGDIMDTLGLQHQFLSPEIRPLHREMVAVGRALTVLEADVFASEGGGSNPVLSRPFGLMLEALDDLQPNEIYICTGASPRYALWGELMSTRAIKLGAAGAVLDGYCRDAQGILTLDFPTFCFGSYGQDQAPRGKVVDFRVPLETNGVRIMNGDVVFGDSDGVCIIPRDAEEEVFSLALEKARGEKLVREAIENGMSAVAAFRQYGIL